MNSASFCFCRACDCHRLVNAYGMVCDACRDGDHLYAESRLRLRPIDSNEQGGL